MLGWLESVTGQPVTTVINRAEILAGIALLPAGWRRERLASSADVAFGVLGVRLPLVPDWAREYAEIVSSRRASGRPIGGMDALIASIVRISGSQFAARDVRDFEGWGSS